jgi:hypothetical protein
VSDLTPEELDEARAEEAWRLFVEQPGDDPQSRVIAARLAREGWTPPPKVDPDLLAAREWGATTELGYASHYAEGVYDEEPEIIGYLAGIKHGRGSRPEIVWPDRPDARSAAYGSGWIDAVEAIRAQVKGKS